ncbi:MAG: amidohydrolase family protein [Fimbriiglobus sp.]
MRRFRARWILPVDRPPMRDATIAIADGKILSLDHGPYDEDLGEVAVIPGLINAHTHLDLTEARGAIPPDPSEHFTQWLLRVIAWRKRHQEVEQPIREGLREALRFGTTGLVDISNSGYSYEPLRDAPLRSAVLFELIGLKNERADSVLEDFSVWREATEDTTTCQRGFSPHAPYSTRDTSYLIPIIQDQGRIMATHLAEMRDEADFLRHHTGPIRDFLDTFNAFDELALQSDFRSVMSELSEHNLYVHGNYLPEDTEFPSNSSLVICPRTHAAFGHDPHPWPVFQKRGVNVCVGTDSLASNPDLDLLAELRHLWRTGQHNPATLLEMGTINAAKALGWEGVTGTLTPGKSADFVAVPLPTGSEDIYEKLFTDHPGTRRVWFQGQEVKC